MIFHKQIQQDHFLVHQLHNNNNNNNNNNINNNNNNNNLRHEWVLLVQKD